MSKRIVLPVTKVTLHVAPNQVCGLYLIALVSYYFTIYKESVKLS